MITGMNNCVLYKGLDSAPQTSNIDCYFSERGSFGSGFYCVDIDSALVYSSDVLEHILKVNVAMVNPMVVRVGFEQGWAMDFDSAALPLLRKLFTEDDVLKLVRDSEDGLFDETIQLAVTQKGHDGLIVIYDEGACFETIVYDKNVISLCL